MKTIDEITASPLCWPDGWKRRGGRARALFKPHSVYEACQRIKREIWNMQPVGARWTQIISTNLRLRQDGEPISKQRAPDDPGAAVYFTYRRTRNEPAAMKVIALDKYDKVQANLWAIALSIDALRSIERWGGGAFLDRAFTGFARLPGPSWRSVLNLAPTVTDPAEVERAWRRLRSTHHPDKGGDPDQFRQIAAAVERARAELGPADQLIAG